LTATALSLLFTDTAPPEIYTLSLHDALPICRITSGLTHGRPLDFHLQKYRNPWRCQRRTVSGLTRMSAERHWPQTRAKLTQKARSARRSLGLGALCWRMASC